MKLRTPTENRSDHPQAGLNDATMMWLLLVAGFVILIGGGGARILLDHWNMLPGLIKNGLNPVVLMGASFYCFYYSKKYYARMMGTAAADELMKVDPRPPVLYLRPFRADDKEGAPRWLHLETQEEKLASVFMNIGPFVALGKPQEKFPTLGAARTYVEDDWETAVINVMARARLVVVRAGNGRALNDEVERATRAVQPQQMLIIVPSGRKNYEAFCANVRHCFPHPLPTYPSWKTSRTRIKGLICFDSDWTPRFLTFGHRFLRGSIFNPLPRALQATLRPVCERLGIPGRSPSINWIRLGFIGLLALAVFYGLYEKVKLN